MTVDPAESSAALPFLEAVVVDRSTRRSPLEEEVTAMFDQLRNPLLRYIRSLGMPLEDGEEIIQEVFLSLFVHLNRGKSRANLRGWLFRVAHNLALKRRMRDHRLMRMQCSEAAAERQPDPNPDPEEQLASLQRQQRLRAVVRVLPEHDRCCLSLRAEGLRYREIAEVLGMSLGAVSLSLGRSLTRLSNADLR